MYEVSVDLVHFNRRLDKTNSHLLVNGRRHMQRHFKSEDHTECSVYLFLVHMNVVIAYDVS